MLPTALPAALRAAAYSLATRHAGAASAAAAHAALPSSSTMQQRHGFLPAGTCFPLVQSSSAQRACYSTPSLSQPDKLHVTVEPHEYEGVSVINLNRPAARNAIGRQLLRELAEAINILRQESTTRCVVLRSVVSDVFCAGADLKERAMMTHAEATEFVNSLRRTMSDLQAIPIPTIAAIDGHALGGGAELALACDMRVVGPRATFAFPEAQLGIIPGAGGTQRLPRLIGLSKAKELIFTCRKVAASEALELGLADYGVAEGSAFDKALELAKTISHSAPLSLRMAKEAMNQGLNVDLASGLKVEEACYARLLPTKDRFEGLKAFAEKRRPHYTGE